MTELIDRMPAWLYWRLRHTAIFMMNMPFYPIFAVYALLREAIANILGCFLANGSSQIMPFWNWPWRDGQ